MTLVLRLVIVFQHENVFGLGDVFEREENLRVQKLIDNLLIRLILTQEAIVEIAILRWINAHKVPSSLVLKDGFNDDLLLPGRQLQELIQIFFLNPIDFAQVLDLIIYLILNLFVLSIHLFRQSFCLILALAIVIGVSAFWLYQANQVEGIFD